MNPELFISAMILVAVGVLFVAWFRDWRGYPRVSPTRDRNKPVVLPNPDDGRPRPGVSDVDDIAAEASCGGDVGGGGDN